MQLFGFVGFDLCSYSGLSGSISAVIRVSRVRSVQLFGFVGFELYSYLGLLG